MCVWEGGGGTGGGGGHVQVRGGNDILRPDNSILTFLELHKTCQGKNLHYTFNDDLKKNEQALLLI